MLKASCHFKLLGTLKEIMTNRQQRTNANNIESIKDRIVNHSLFSSFKDIEHLKIFMEHHVICVWDFMLLLKNLQNAYCPVTVSSPWVPPKNRIAARMIHEILLVEESDHNPAGGYCSHFELYIQAMDEIGANTKPICDFLQEIDNGKAVAQALNSSALPPASKKFAATTLSSIAKGPATVANVFLVCRENLIPEMFIPIVSSLENGEFKATKFLYYLNRHIEVDGQNHGPMAKELESSIMICDQEKEIVHSETMSALEARESLWTQIEAEIRQGPSHYQRTRIDPYKKSSSNQHRALSDSILE